MMLPMAMLGISAAVGPPAVWDVCGMLERELQGRMTPFLAGRRGAFYFGGASVAGGDYSVTWPVYENETLGLTHPFFRDGRARGDAITCDEITGCGHSLWGWDFYRSTRVLYGSVQLDLANGSAVVYTNPAPTSVKWRPDRITVTYSVHGMTLQETKFFTNDDVLVSVIRLIDRGLVLPASARVTVLFRGSSYVNTKPIPASDPSSHGLPAGTAQSQQRNSTVDLDQAFGTSCGGVAGTTGCSAVRLEEHGTGYAKPIDCQFGPLPKGVDCKAKVGPMMYDNMTVFLAASQDISKTASLGTDSERRALYNFSVVLAPSLSSSLFGAGQSDNRGIASGKAKVTPIAAPSAVVVVGWAQGDDADETRNRIQAVMTVEAAMAALQDRTDAANLFMSTMVPQINITERPLLAASAAASVAAPDWTVHDGYTCEHDDQKLKFVSKATLTDCEAACMAEPGCVSFVASLPSPGWCALYGTKVTPIPNLKFACVCKGHCPASPPPRPPPGPRPPTPPIPPVPPAAPARGVADAYYYGWAMYWMLLLDAGRAPFETVPHAQSAPNNFLGLHQHDTQYYLNVGSFVAAKYHPTYAHGNVLMWKHAFESPMMRGGGGGYWEEKLAKGILPDNLGGGWIASSTSDEIVDHIEGAWHIFNKGGNRTYGNLAYDFYKALFTPASGNLTDPHQKANWGGGGVEMSGLAALAKLARALGHDDDATAWETVMTMVEGPRFSKSWMAHKPLTSLDVVKSVVAPEPYFQDAWAVALADEWLLNSNYGFYPPNRSFGAPLLAFANNVSYDGPWAAHTTKTVEVVDGLFRHHAGDAAINLTLEHIEAMQRDYGFTVYPEAWDKDGGLWGDQWYNWGSSLAVLLPLQRMIGVDFSVVEHSDAAAEPGVMTVCDYIGPTWDQASALVPIGATVGGEDGDPAWAKVVVERVNATAKRITVTGNPLGTLRLQPWLEGHTLVTAEPAGYTVETPSGHVSWTFVGQAAAAAAVTVSW